MASPLAEFRAQHAPAQRRSALDPFGNELAQLLEDGYSLRQLLAYLASNGVHTSLSNLHGFVARWRRRHTPPPDMTATPANSASAPAPAAHTTAPLRGPEPQLTLDRPAAALSPDPAPSVQTASDAAAATPAQPPAPARAERRPAGSVREIIRQARAQPHNLYEYGEIARKAFALRDAERLKGDPANPVTIPPTAKP